MKCMINKDIDCRCRMAEIADVSGVCRCIRYFQFNGKLIDNITNLSVRVSNPGPMCPAQFKARKPNTTKHCMTRNEQKKALQILSSGDFTLASHDYGEFDLYRGKHEYDDLPEESDFTFNMSDNVEGYMPHIVQLLVTCLGGKWDSA